MDAHRSSPTIALLTLARSAEVEVSRILEPAGLSVRKLVLLQRLASMPGATLADLARTARITTDDVAPVVRAMATAGLVKHSRDGALSISESGSEALTIVETALAALDEQAYATTPDLAAALLDATQPPLGPPQD